MKKIHIFSLFLWIILFFQLLFWSEAATKHVQTDKCGIRAAKFERSAVYHNERIVGGHQSATGSWPWSASIIHRDMPLTRYCGAALIHSRWLVTAAHCFKFDFVFDNAGWYAELGKYNSSVEESYSQYLDIVKIVKHPRFDDSLGTYNDIALLQLNQSVRFDYDNYTINSVCLSDFDLLAAADSAKKLNFCFSIGWGADRREGHSLKFLKEVRLPLVTTEKCFAKHGFNLDSNTQICAGGFDQGGAGTCFGDSGGPLQCLIDNQWHLIGVTSYGKACALPQTPDVFTKIASYSEWIQQTIASAN